MKKARNPFTRVRNLKPSRSYFPLHYEKKFDCDPGELIPVCHDEVVPGDFLKIGTKVVVRLAPLVAPILHEINVFVHYFFVPYRLLFNEKTHHDLGDVGTWESFITGGENGLDASVLPRWDGSGSAAYSLWDYFGFPLVANCGTYTPVDFPRRAYNFVYNEFYRDENLITKVALDSTTVKKRRWKKDYFSSALPWQQRGTAPALPISGTTSAQWANPVTVDWPAVGTGTVDTMGFIDATSTPGSTGTKNALENNTVNNTQLEANTIDLSVASTFDIADLRNAFGVQKWMERNARGGVRYTEFLRSHHGVSPRDDRLDRPEYIGGMKCPVIISEVLQTSKTDTVSPASPQGNMAGHGIAVDVSFCGKYHVVEYGMILGILSIMPKPLYQQGMPRQWRKTTKYDFFTPEFVNFSEQAIENGEIYVTNNDDATNVDLFGYQGMYDELRVKHDMVVAGFRDTWDTWHMSRQFSSVPDLNQSFIECTPRKDCFAAPSSKCCFVSIGNYIDAFRPLPVIAEPGLLDH